ncbi:MAG TPA: hypothetical protein VFN45_19030 [Myxococcaceae bacterium]|nr:hypothetical protein [Myxococcaceae bacterium]
MHPETAGTDSFVVVTSANAQGQDVREARVKVQPGAPTTEALGLLADWAAVGGEAAPPVEVTRGPGAKPLPVAPVVAAGAAAGAAGAAAATSPAASAPPAPAPSSEPDPNATHFEVALRVGIGVPLGSAYQTTGGTEVSLSDWSSITIPVQLDLGVRLGGSWFLGGYFSYGFAGSAKVAFPTFTCGTGDVSCSPKTLRFGGQVHWHVLGNVATDPWIGLGSGYEKVSIGVSGGGSDASLDISGWEFANLQLGIDFALGSAVKIGPWVSFSVGQYSSAGGSSGGSGLSAEITNKTMHEWLMGGVRLVLLP